MNKQAGMYLSFIAYAIALVVCGTRIAGTSWWWLIVPITWFASGSFRPLLRLTLERNVRIEMDDPKTQPWAFLVGDTVLLPVALAVFAYGGYRSSINYDTSIIPLAVGLAAGILLYCWEAGRYEDANAMDVFFSPTKLAGSMVACPVFVALVVLLATPLLLRTGETLPWLMIGGGCIGLWGVLVSLDSLRRLDPHAIYPAWDEGSFEPKKAR